MKVKDLGAFEGPVLLWGGAYSNLQATKALFDWADQAEIPQSHRISTGDAVAYCANPVETWDLIAERGGQGIAGNVEKQIAAGSTDCGCGFREGTVCDTLSKGWYPHAARMIDDTRRIEMAALPDVLTFQLGRHRVAVIHGGVTDVSRFLFSETLEPVFLAEILAVSELVGKVDIIVAGHSGIAFKKKVNDVLWLNAGVIGMPPNDGHTGGQFTFVEEDGLVQLRLPYDHVAASQAMQVAGLTQGYETSLVTGHWPSEDILPLSMRRPS